ncbi:MAG TPA: LysM peptidoglycan-binding domain-containing protein [Pyrinomonadaceae bacterium]|jgi:phage protein U|nr:LysM peptidoglycan-binding domain-containing protein [Pyrinomonadaceae bacterium]
MALEKLKIKNVDKPQNSFDVLFNPTEYSFEDGSTWQDQERNRQKPELQYTGGERVKLTMELFFDTYETGEDVRAHTSKLANLLVPKFGDGKRPPVLELSWGQADPSIASAYFPFVCVLEKLTQKFTLFNETGTPVRATANVTFKQFRLPEEELKRNPQRKSFPQRVYTVRSGDTLSGIAAKHWKDPTRWREIADSNPVDNPRLLEPGQTLLIPAIE